MTTSTVRPGHGRAYRFGSGVAGPTAFLTVWTTIVQDDGSGRSFFLIIMAAIVGGFAAWFSAAGMARTMLGVAILQVLLGLAIATAPITAAVLGASSRALLFNAVFAAPWLTAAACFRVADKAERYGTMTAPSPNGV